MKKTKEWARMLVKLADKYYAWGGNHTEEEFMNDLVVLEKFSYLKGFRAGVEANKEKIRQQIADLEAAKTDINGSAYIDGFNSALDQAQAKLEMLISKT